ncbi:hypothetical protein DNTS_001482 [Danionella cerebrum]|uniref:Ig-like domain-containing protein n=1 Tax=Danionella cerebrum TaxID=2873325 RepID=A0A553N510_9TELE|nr:hypothetical protein DNTS_001482 [Danionella translucida]
MLQVPLQGMRPLLYAELTVGWALVVFAQNPTCPSLCTCVLQGQSNTKGLRSAKRHDQVSSRADVCFQDLKGSFTNLSSLHELRLDGNLLSSFPWEGLRDMPSLRTLGLHNNRLARIPAFAARYLGNVTYLDLSSNRLSTLANDITALWVPGDGNLTQRAVVLGLQDNPWQCDCRLSTLLELSKAPEGAVVLLDRLLTCSQPPHLAGLSFHSLELSHCRRPYVLASVTEVTAPVGSSILLRCQATGRPVPTVMWIKSARASKNNQGCCQQTQINIETERLPRKIAGYVQAFPQMGIRWSVVSLNGVSYRDSGEYRCRAQNIAGISEAVVSLKVTGLMSEFVDSKNDSWRKTKPEFLLLHQNMTTLSSSPPERVAKAMETSEDQTKTDRAFVQNRSRTKKIPP